MRKETDLEAVKKVARSFVYVDVQINKKVGFLVNHPYIGEIATAVKLKLSITAYPLLEQWYPDKEYSYVLSATPQTSTTNGDKFDEVKKYKELLDSGIISEAEFEAKRKELLGL